MNRSIILLAAIAAVAIGGYSGIQWFARPGTISAASPNNPEITYLCRETKKVVRGPRQTGPVINPATGRATLVPALYCRECKKWRAAPPEAMRERMPTGPLCPVHRVPLSETVPDREGPSPATSARFSTTRRLAGKR